jgi:hypothetical protein
VDQRSGTLGGQEPITRWAREEANVDHPQASDVAPWKA